MSTALQRSFFTLVSIYLVSCQSFNVGTNSIKTVQGQWPHYSTVQLQGRIVERVQLLESWAYAVQDSTGKIWVLADHPAPRLGEQVWLKGKVRYQAVLIGSQDLGEAYIVEGVRLKTTTYP